MENLPQSHPANSFNAINENNFNSEHQRQEAEKNMWIGEEDKSLTEAQLLELYYEEFRKYEHLFDEL